QLPHLVDAAVGGGVELVHVERATGPDRLTRIATAARLAVLGGLTVEGRGQDAGRGRLPGAARPAEEIGVGDVALAHRVPQRAGDVVLPLDLLEPAGPEPPVQGFVGPSGGLLDHRADTTRSDPPVDAAVRLDCGTRADPLRAAASR